MNKCNLLEVTKNKTKKLITLLINSKENSEISLVALCGAYKIILLKKAFKKHSFVQKGSS